MQDKQTQVEQVVEAVRESSKYRSISLDLIRNMAAREIAQRRNVKEATKATKNKLHQVAGAYFASEPHYATWLNDLASADGNTARLQEVCTTIMRSHASTQERLPFLDRFYSTTLAGIQPVHSVLDLACGLNPLALPWMPLASHATYYACDIYADLASFLNQFFELAAIRGTASVCDISTMPPQQEADLALILKALPVLEQINRSASIRLLKSLQVRHALVSFPARSLGGRNKGMAHNYEVRFHDMIGAEGWAVQRFEFPTELAFLVTFKP